MNKQQEPHWTTEIYLIFNYRQQTKILMELDLDWQNYRTLNKLANHYRLTLTTIYSNLFNISIEDLNIKKHYKKIEQTLETNC